MDFEAKALQHGGDGHSGSLLTIHADGKCLDTTQKEEAIERSESITDRVDNKCYLLQVDTSINLSARAVERGRAPQLGCHHCM